ncbi:MAG: ABC transporter permease [Geminicoccaceae bacterium]
MTGRQAAARGLWLAAAWLPAVVLIVLPLASFLAYSLFRVEGGEIIHQPGLANYARFFGEGVFLPVFLRTCLLAAEVAAITVLVGYPVAIWLASLAGRRKLAMTLAFAVPLLMSYIIKIYAIRAILGSQGWLNSLLLWTGVISTPIEALLFNLTAVLITLSILLLPFTILPILVALERIPRGLFEASADLGASAWATFRWVTWPLSRRGVLIGASFTFVLALGDFVTPQMVGGMSGITFGRIVYSQFGLAFNWPFGAALAVIMTAVVLAVLWLANTLGRPPAEAR